MRRLLAATLLTAFAGAATALPARVTARYQLTNNGVAIGQVNESFVRKGDTYEIHSVSRSEGLLKVFYDETITVQSTGRVVASGLQPLQFEERRARDPKRDVDATFDWDRRVLRSRYRGETSELPLPAATQDRLSMMYQFMHMKARPGTFELAMSNGRKVERYAYRLVGEERVQTPAGGFAALHFERVSAEANDRHIEVWLAKERDHIPIRVVFDDPRGLRIEQTLVELRVE